MRKMQIYRRLFLLSVKHIGHQQFILILAAIIGLFVGLAAVAIKNLVHLIAGLTDLIADKTHLYMALIFPSIGIMLAVVFIKYINQHPVHHGIPGVLHGISKNAGFRIMRRAICPWAEVSLFPGFVQFQSTRQ